MSHTGYKYGACAEKNAKTFAMALRMRLNQCVSDEHRAHVAEILGMAEGATSLLGRSLSSYDECLNKTWSEKT